MIVTFGGNIFPMLFANSAGAEKNVLAGFIASTAFCSPETSGSASGKKHLLKRRDAGLNRGVVYRPKDSLLQGMKLPASGNVAPCYMECNSLAPRMTLPLSWNIAPAMYRAGRCTSLFPQSTTPARRSGASAMALAGWT